VGETHTPSGEFRAHSKASQSKVAGDCVSGKGQAGLFSGEMERKGWICSVIESIL
jgi:hypothetical protein